MTSPCGPARGRPFKTLEHCVRIYICAYIHTCCWCCCCHKLVPDNDEVAEVAEEAEEEAYGGCGRINDSADIGVVGALAAADEGNADGLTVASCVDIGGIGLRVVYTIPAVVCCCCVIWKLGNCGCGKMGFFVGFDGFEGRRPVGFSQLGGRGLVIKFGSVVMCQWCCVTAVSCGDVFQ